MTKSTKTPSLAKASRILGKALAPTVTAAKRGRKAAQAAKADPVPIGAAARVITALVGANRGQDTLATLADGSSASVTGMAAKVGDNYDDVKRAHLAALRMAAEAAGASRPPAQLARGVEARKAPHSAKAVQDQPRAAKPANAKKAERKAARAERAAPKADDPRKITIVDKKFTFGGDGTARRASWDACKAAKTVAAYLKAGGKAKYLPRWVASGAIKLVG